MEYRDLLRRTHMVRRFRQDPVPDEVLHGILLAALRGPSAGFSQGTHLLVLVDHQTTRFWQITTDPRFLRTDDEVATQPRVIVLPLSDKRPYLERYSKPDRIAAGLDVERRGLSHTGISIQPWPSCSCSSLQRTMVSRVGSLEYSTVRMSS
jgi:nitroreductase